MNYSIDKTYLIETLQALVRINSINPDLIAGAPGEAEMARYIQGALQKMNIQPEISFPAPDRPNVVGRISGSSNGPSLMLNAHTDTVGVEGMEAPFTPAVEDGKLYGRGAQDMKGSIAAMLTAAKALQESDIRLQGDLLLAFVADEEYGSIGTEALVRRYPTDAAILTEPTDLEVCIAHKGFGVFELKTFGKAAHGGRYQEGVDANIRMGKVLVELEKLSRRLMSDARHPLLGIPSLHIPRISGGDELFIYAAECTAMIERRTIPGETSSQVFAELEDIIASLQKGDPSFRADVRPIIWRDPFEITKDAAIVRAVVDSVRQSTGRQPAFIAHHWWEDSALLAEAGIETVVLGPKGAGLHTPDEWVDIESLIELSDILVRSAISYCNGPRDDQ